MSMPYLKDCVGFAVGKQGKTIKYIQRRTQTYIHFGDRVFRLDDGSQNEYILCTVKGKWPFIACCLLLEKMVYHCKKSSVVETLQDSATTSGGAYVDPSGTGVTGGGCVGVS